MLSVQVAASCFNHRRVISVCFKNSCFDGKDLFILKIDEESRDLGKCVEMFRQVVKGETAGNRWLVTDHDNDDYLQSLSDASTALI